MAREQVVASGLVVRDERDMEVATYTRFYGERYVLGPNVGGRRVAEWLMLPCEMARWAAAEGPTGNLVVSCSTL